MGYKKYILLPVILWLTNQVAQGQDSVCTEKDILQEIVFSKKQIKLSSKHKATLDSIVRTANKCPKLSLVITSSSAACHHNAFIWDRLNAVALYVIEKGIRSENVTLNYSDRNSCETINFKLALIESSQDEPPHPNLRKNETSKPKNQLP